MRADYRNRHQPVWMRGYFQPVQAPSSCRTSLKDWASLEQVSSNDFNFCWWRDPAGSRLASCQRTASDPKRTFGGWLGKKSEGQNGTVALALRHCLGSCLYNQLFTRRCFCFLAGIKAVTGRPATISLPGISPLNSDLLAKEAAGRWECLQR
jgi:hypothetical protein